MNTGRDMVGHLRTNDRVFMKFVRSWWQQLLPRMRPLLFSEGGPILMVQIENEYGFRTFLREQPYLQVQDPLSPKGTELPYQFLLGRRHYYIAAVIS